MDGRVSALVRGQILVCVRLEAPIVDEIRRDGSIYGIANSRRRGGVEKGIARLVAERNHLGIEGGKRSSGALGIRIPLLEQPISSIADGFASRSEGVFFARDDVFFAIDVPDGDGIISSPR